MTSPSGAVKTVLAEQEKSGKSLAVVLAGHNGSGKSTLWYEYGLADTVKIPLINADRMMLSILPEADSGKSLPGWASGVRDGDTNWMRVAQKGVEGFVAQAMHSGVAFAMETVFSHWREKRGGQIESKIDLIRKMREEGYFVLLLFVGLSNMELSIGRVRTRIGRGGHRVEETRLRDRFPRTQKAIRFAASVADSTIMIDNSGSEEEAFTVCRIQIGEEEIYDCRNAGDCISKAALQWLDVVSPRVAPLLDS